jgi:hypothetical protein
MPDQIDGVRAEPPALDVSGNPRRVAADLSRDHPTRVVLGDRGPEGTLTPRVEADGIMVDAKPGWDYHTTWRTAIQWRAALDAYWHSDAPFAVLDAIGNVKADLAERVLTNHVIELWREAAHEGSTVWVDEEMTELAREMGTAMPRDIAIYADQLLAPSGLIVFERPLHILAKTAETETPEPMNVSALGWSVVDGRLWLADYEATARREVYWSSQDRHIPLPEGLMPMVVTDSVPLGEPLTESDWMMGRVYLTALLLMAQRFAAKETRHADRATARRVERGGGVIRTVTITTLRRPTTKPPAGHVPSSREYSHRWWVRKHFRKQWYPSLGEHRTIPIDPYVKGPADKPIVYKERGFKWTR